MPERLDPPIRPHKFCYDGVGDPDSCTFTELTGERCGLSPGYHGFDPQQSAYNAVLANLASLNEIVAALFSGLALGERPDEQYASLVFRTLRTHSWRLGFMFNEERPPAEWYENEERKRYALSRSSDSGDDGRSKHFDRGGIRRAAHRSVTSARSRGTNRRATALYERDQPCRGVVAVNGGREA